MKRREFLETLVVSGTAATSVPLNAATAPPALRLARGDAQSAATHPSPPDSTPGIFYQPQNAWLGDCIPFYHEGQFYLFYLHDWRDPDAHGEGVPWHLVTTRDFAHFTDRGEMLARGTDQEQDASVFTGSVLQAQGQYHIFYTGHNGDFPDLGKPMQGIMHAVSDDLLHWKKVPDDTFYARVDRYERNDWRDPFVFWNPEAAEYWMLVAARLKSGPGRLRGCTALCTSKDLRHWSVREEPFWSPGLYYTHECPDLFRIGDWWYLVFSEYTELVRTRYRMSRSLAGPWLAPKQDCFDGRDFYAAKTVSDGQRRYLCGWNPTNARNKDFSSWNWGGTLVVHELQQERDGTLSVDMPRTLESAWSHSATPRFALNLGNVRQLQDRLEIAAPGTFACAASEPMPDRCRIQAQIQFDRGTRGCGILLRTSDDLNSTYFVRFEPDNHRFVFDAFPRGAGAEDGYVPGLSRAIELDPHTPVTVNILIDRSIGVIYVNGKIALNVRMNDRSGGRWGFFVDQGSATFHQISIQT